MLLSHWYETSIGEGHAVGWGYKCLCLRGGGLSAMCECVSSLSFRLAQFPISRQAEALLGLTDQYLFTAMTLIIFILFSLVSYLGQFYLSFIVPVCLSHFCFVSTNAMSSNIDFYWGLCLSFSLFVFLSNPSSVSLSIFFSFSFPLLIPSPLYPHLSHSILKTRSIGLLIWLILPGCQGSILAQALLLSHLIHK